MLEASLHIEIDPNGLKINGKSQELDDFSLKVLYQYLNLDYSKFFKMDGMSKLGLLGTEVLLKEIGRQDDFEDQLGLLFYNTSSSKQSDLNYWNKALEKKANPSLFVYTLPNIVLGEISIKNKLFGESLFIIQNEIKENEIQSIMETWFELNKAKYCIIGMIEYSSREEYLAKFEFHRKKEK